MKKPHTVNKATKRIYELVHNQEQEGKFVLILCGRIGEVWIDAHADIDILETSSSGRIHGMPVAFFCGLVG